MVALALAAAVLTLHNGQTRYLLPSEAHTGMEIRCGFLTGRLPAPPSTDRASFTDMWVKSRPAFSIGRRPNGSTMVSCGVARPAVPSGAAPYVIGHNGLALIRGPNTFTQLVRVYGASRRSGCRATWPRIGLVATFTGAHCDVLAGAVVDDRRWRSLNGVSIGDGVGKLVWESPGAKQLAASRWQLAPGLVAEIRSGHVARLVLSRR